jgi:hypothetical protein
VHVINILNNCNCAWLLAYYYIHIFFAMPCDQGLSEEDNEGGGGGGAVSHLPTLNISIAN